MKPSIVLSTVFLVALSIRPAFGQERFSLSVHVAPLYSQSNSERDLYIPTATGQLIVAALTSHSTGWGYSLGVMGRYTVSSHWSASTGFWLSRTWFNAPTIVADPIVDIQALPSRTQTYQIPVLVNYQVSTKRLSPYFSAGALLNLLGSSYLTGSDGQEYAFSPSDRHVRILPTIGAGLRYLLANRLAIIAQPTISYSLPQSGYVYMHSYQLRLQAQLLYTL